MLEIKALCGALKFGSKFRPTGLSADFSRPLFTSTILNGFRDRFVPRKDQHKRPSDLEIERKKLPKNTPTLGERLRRDASSPYHVRDRRSGYSFGPTGTWQDFVDPDETTKEIMVEGAKQLKEEIILWKDELITEQISDTPRFGEERLAFSFETEEKRNDWIVTCDSTWGEGYSTAEIVESPVKGKMIFRGDLSTRIPQDGRIQCSGYANIKSVLKLKSFARVEDLGWGDFTHLVLRVRGDGRTYNLNLHRNSDLDVHWNDLWSYPLYTRGGPYWQTTVIPFSSFFLNVKGVIQDAIIPIDQEEVVSLGITCADRIDGPFCLEMDTIKVKHDPNLQSEVTPYETYRYPRPNFNTH